MKRERPHLKIFSSFKEEEKYNIEYEINLTPEERFRIADALKKKVYGENAPDVRASGVVIIKKREKKADD